MHRRIVDSLGYILFFIVMGFAISITLLWTEESSIARLIYEGL